MPEPGPGRPEAAPPAPLAARLAWCLYDFANSGFPTVVVTGVYVLTYKKVVVGGGPQAGPEGDFLWGLANSLAGLLVFLSAPFFGAWADLSGGKRRWLVATALVSILATAALPLAGRGEVLFASILLVLAAAGFEASLVFYNAFLPELVPPERTAWWSGLGWGIGYLGGLGCLLLVFALFGGRGIEGMRGAPFVTALWFAVFALPAFVLLRDRAPRRPAGFAAAAGRLRETLRALRAAETDLARFLAAFFLYNNAVGAVIVFAVGFTDQSLGFTLRENILLIVVLNLVAAPGALVFGRIATGRGTKRALVLALWIWLAVCAGAIAAAWPGLFTKAGAKLFFWGVAALAAVGLGAIQATSRSFLALLAPAEESAGHFGLYALAGKASAILGPFVFGLVSRLFRDQRPAVASLALFFAAGLWLLLGVRDPERAAGGPS